MQANVVTNINVDLNEVSKFDDMAQDWWDPNGSCKPLHDLNPLRLAFIQSHCSLATRSILDIGCGGGILTEALSRFSPHVTGIDQSQKVLDIAKSHATALSTPPNYVLETCETYAERLPGTFDIITCMEMLEHVPDPLSVLEAASKLLKPGGDLILSTLNRTPKAFLVAILGAEYVLKMLPKGTHEYEKFIRPSELVQAARFCELELKHIKGISYQLFTKQFYLSEDVAVNYIAHFKKGDAFEG